MTPSTAPPAEFTVNGHNYRAGRLDARTAFHVAKSFAPVFLWLAQMKKGGPDADVPPPERFGQAMVAVSAGVPKEAADFVLDTCLGVAVREQAQGAGWSAVRSSNGRLMFEDIDLGEMMQIVRHVAEHNGLVDFFFVPADVSPLLA
jgi:hypothetical protein